MGLKCNLTLGKKFTINTGNYSSIQPNISLTINDLPVSKILDVKKAMSVIVDSMFLKEAITDFNDMKAIKSLGIKKMMESIDKEQMEEDVKKAIVELMKADGEWEV
jgi:hypothetical protein